MRFINRTSGLPVQEDGQPSDTKEKKSCSYCFVTHLARVSPDNILYALPAFSKAHNDGFSYKDTILLPVRAERYEARAPPYTA